MNRFLLSALSFLVLLFLLSADNEAFAKKKKRKKRTKARHGVVAQPAKDSVKVVKAPGVPNQVAYDSMKKAKMLEKMKTGHALVVSFISTGTGIDAEAQGRFEKELNNFNQRNTCRLVAEAKAWGREGERDYCVVCLDETCLSTFAKQVKSLFKGNSRVLVQEHAACRP